MTARSIPASSISPSMRSAGMGSGRCDSAPGPHGSSGVFAFQMCTCASVIMRSSLGLDGVLTETASHIRVPCAPSIYMSCVLQFDREIAVPGNGSFWPSLLGLLKSAARGLPRATLSSRFLLDHPVCSHEQRLGDGQPERFRRFQINHKFDFRRLLDGEVTRFRALDYLVYVPGRSIVVLGEVLA